MMFRPCIVVAVGVLLATGITEPRNAGAARPGTKTFRARSPHDLEFSVPKGWRLWTDPIYPSILAFMTHKGAKISVSFGPIGSSMRVTRFIARNHGALERIGFIVDLPSKISKTSDVWSCSLRLPDSPLAYLQIFMRSGSRVYVFTLSRSGRDGDGVEDDFKSLIRSAEIGERSHLNVKGGPREDPDSSPRSP